MMKQSHAGESGESGGIRIGEVRIDDDFRRNGAKRGRRIYRRVDNDMLGFVSRNQFQALADDEVPVCPVEAKKLTRLSEMLYNVADVQRPLASAVLVAQAGNTVMLGAQGGYIENNETKERMEVKIEKNTYVFVMQMEDGTEQTVTLDSGAGCNVWPVHIQPAGVIMNKNVAEVKMIAANGSPIRHYGQAAIRFRGIDASGFTRPR